jgi:NifU-like protein involved in Fe-S cluster formation
MPENLNYTKEVVRRFQKPKFVKKLKNPDAVGEVGNPRCGDVMRMEVKIDKKTGKISDIGFQTYGCPAAIATSDVVCELAKGKTLKQAGKITSKDVVKELKHLPAIKLHCSVLGIEALKEVIKDYEKKTKK